MTVANSFSRYDSKRIEALEYVANRAREFRRVATIYNMTSATQRAWDELGEALASLKVKRGG